MPNKNDLSALKVTPKNSLVEARKQQAIASIPTPVWRKPKPKQEKQSEVIGLRFTPSEKAHIEKLAGLIPIATFLKDKLEKETNLFHS